MPETEDQGEQGEDDADVPFLDAEARRETAADAAEDAVLATTTQRS